MRVDAVRFGIAWVLAGLGFVAGMPAWAGTPRPPTPAVKVDPASVERFGPAYRYPQAGWIVLHVEGEPYERGYQHGRLLASEIADYVAALALKASPRAPGDGWKHTRTLVDALFLRRYDREYLEEMKGIADGAAAAGAKYEGRALDLIDVAAVNSEIEVDLLENALQATPHGLEGRTFAEPAEGRPRPPQPDHCSAFAANGPATADGSIVFGHITMWNVFASRHFNVWLDVRPSRGHRVLMQSYPGGIQSGMDYYMNDAGLLVAETTITQTKFNPEGEALASRIRRVLQYADSIDDASKILTTSNNGMYTNEWLLADTRTNEIAMLELGTDKHRLWRSSKDEWFGGTRGFYWGCNNAKDLAVRLETIPSVEDRPANVVFHPADRDRTWLRLFHEEKSKINVDFGFRAFTTPPLSASHSLDAKFTTATLSKELKTWAKFGPPLGRTWEPTPRELEARPGTRPLVANDWTLLTAELPPSPSEGEKPAVDLASSRKKDAGDSAGDAAGTPRAAWHGTILPANDADIWLAAAFADYEKLVAREKAIHEKAKGRALNPAEQDRLRLDLFAPRSRYLTAVERLGRDIPLSAIRPDLERDEWYQIASGKGVLLLAALRAEIGDASFLKLMDGFGRAHAGRPASVGAFRERAESVIGRDLSPFFATWLDGKGLPDDPGGHFWSIDAFEAEPEISLIVYGTLKDAEAQREAAGHLQRIVAAKWYNLPIPIRSDAEVTDADLKSHHIILIGRPETNAVAGKLVAGLPLAFGPASFVLRGETYAHAGTSLIAAGPNPFRRRHEVVLLAGLGAESTWRCVQTHQDRRTPPAEVWLSPAGGRAHSLVVSPASSHRDRARNTTEAASR